MLLETILGGVTGLLGNVISSIFKYKANKLENEMLSIKNAHEIAMVRAESDAMIAEAKANIAIAKAQIEGEVELADANAYVQSQKEGNKTFFSNKWIDTLLGVQGYWKIITFPAGVLIAILFGLVDFLRGLMRPTLTAYLVGMSTWITFMAWQIMQQHGMDITAAEAKEIFTNTTSIVVYLTVSCVTWWFGDRRMAKTIMQMNGNGKKNGNGIDDIIL